MHRAELTECLAHRIESARTSLVISDCPMEKDYLTLKRAPASRPSSEWKDDDYDVLADGEIVGRIFNAVVSVARPWMWTLDIGYHEHRSPTHGYAATREAAIAAFAKSWRRE